MTENHKTTSYTLGLRDIDQTKLAIVGGKGANLGELAMIDGISVPEGFCVTTEAYKRIFEQTPQLDALLGRLALLKIEDVAGVREISKKIRDAIEATPIGKEIEEAVADQLAKLGARDPCAVRSSAAAEDLPTASFAGQQDTYLNVMSFDRELLPSFVPPVSLTSAPCQ